MNEKKKKAKIHCEGCGRTIAVDEKDKINVTCHRCGAINPIDKNIHPSKKTHMVT